MADFAAPSADPADDDTLAGVLRTAMRKQLLQLENSLPARVIAFDRVQNRATVQPLVRLLATDNTTLGRPQIASVPVLQAGGGGVVLAFNLKPGDLGWIHASDRDISTFLQGYGETQPNTLRIHSFEDGVFIPDVMRGWTLSGDDAEAAVLQTLDGSAKVSLQTGKIVVAVEGSVLTVDADQLQLARAGKSVTVGAGGTTIVGGLVVDGITFGTHRHPDPQGGNTGGPIN